MKLINFFSYVFITLFLVNLVGFLFLGGLPAPYIYGLVGDGRNFISIIILFIYAFKATVGYLILTNHKDWFYFAKVDAIAGLIIYYIVLICFIGRWDSNFQAKRILSLDILFIIPYILLLYRIGNPSKEVMN